LQRDRKLRKFFLNAPKDSINQIATNHCTKGHWIFIAPLPENKESNCPKLAFVVIVQQMENVLFTILAATLLMGFALFLLAIGFLLSGKKLRRGCGLTPKRQKEKKDNTTCSLCGSHKPCDNDEETHEDT